MTFLLLCDTIVIRGGGTLITYGFSIMYVGHLKRKTEVEVMTKKVINRKNLERLIGVVEFGLMVTIVIVGDIISGCILCHFCPVFEVATLAKTLGTHSGYALGIWAFFLASSVRRRQGREILSSLGWMVVFAVVCVATGLFVKADMPSMILVLTLQVVVGLVAVILAHCCDEGANHIQNKLFGNMVKVDGLWLCFYELDGSDD